MNRISEDCARILIVVLAFSMVAVANGWRQQSCDLWTWQDIVDIVNKSPWVRFSSTSFAAPAVIGQNRKGIAASSGMGVGGGDGGNHTISNHLIPLFPSIRLITAKPIRDALLRQSFLQELYGIGGGGRPIDVKTLTREASDRAKEAQDKFAKSNPIIMGDAEHIVVSIVFVPSYMNVPSVVMLYGVGLTNPLEGVSQSDLVPVTFLSTKTGKRMVLRHYLPPGKDGLGAKFFFSRTTSDGTASVVMEDKELRFETRIKGKKIEVKFDLSKLVYQGKLEL